MHCPFHGLRYAADGRVVAIPANGLEAEVPENFRVRPWLAVDAFGFIWVFYGKPADAPDDLPMFEEFRGDFPYAERYEVWDVHYSRAIENQLDVIHLPFVHPNTIGRGHKTLVNGPVTEWDDETLTFYVKNEPDCGQTPQTADEIENWWELNSLQYRVPNLWQNRIADDLCVMAAFAPVDYERAKQMCIRDRLCRRAGPLPHCRHVVADGNGRRHDHVAAGRGGHEAGVGGPAVLRRGSARRAPRRERGRAERARKPRAHASLAGHDAGRRCV